MEDERDAARRSRGARSPARTGSAGLTRSRIVEPLDDAVVETGFDLAAGEGEEHDGRIAFDLLARDGGMRIGGDRRIRGVIVPDSESVGDEACPIGRLRTEARAHRAIVARPAPVDARADVSIRALDLPVSLPVRAGKDRHRTLGRGRAGQTGRKGVEATRKIGAVAVRSAGGDGAPWQDPGGARGCVARRSARAGARHDRGGKENAHDRAMPGRHAGTHAGIVRPRASRACLKRSATRESRRVGAGHGISTTLPESGTWSSTIRCASAAAESGSTLPMRTRSLPCPVHRLISSALACSSASVA